jgi:hypothetical protein
MPVVLRRLRWCAASVSGLLSVFAWAPACGADAAAKAEMVWNVTRFVQWPAPAMAASRGQLVVTILGEDDLAAELAQRLSTRSMNGKPVFVRFARRLQDLRGSHVVYLAASEHAQADAALLALAGSPTLTLADQAGFVDRGGMVDFVESEGRIRLEVHRGRAEGAGLRVSSRLLALARVVDGGP